MPWLAGRIVAARRRQRALLEPTQTAGAEAARGREPGANPSIRRDTPRARSSREPKRAMPRKPPATQAEVQPEAQTRGSAERPAAQAEAPPLQQRDAPPAPEQRSVQV
ncbi:hypothetical protein N9L68_02355 [bacterium]|nr:hypothetical protein [bacterium]